MPQKSLIREQLLNSAASVFTSFLAAVKDDGVLLSVALNVEEHLYAERRASARYDVAKAEPRPKLGVQRAVIHVRPLRWGAFILVL